MSQINSQKLKKKSKFEVQVLINFRPFQKKSKVILKNPTRY